MTILEELRSLAEESYKNFNRKIIPTKQKTLGVRIPMLRKIAKRIAKNNPEDFLKENKNNIHEMIMLEGMVLSYMNYSFKELLPLTEEFLLKTDNWAQIDSTICDFKNIRKDKPGVMKIVKRWLKSDKEFIVRAALVILLAHYVEEPYLPEIFKLSQKVKHKGYYVHMANAWLISCCMAKYPEETIEFFKNNRLEDITHNKAIQKSIESYRVSKDNKFILKKIKRKS